MIRFTSALGMLVLMAGTFMDAQTIVITREDSRAVRPGDPVDEIRVGDVVRIRMLWITCGTADSLVGLNRDFKEWLRTKGVRFTEEEAPDVGHVWPYWRKNFAELATKVFQGSTARR